MLRTTGRPASSNVASWDVNWVMERGLAFCQPSLARVSDRAGFARSAGIGLVTGLLMRYTARTDIVALKAFVLGLVYLDWRPLPGDPLLLLHLGLAAALMIVFPFSKLLHAPGVFFSPTRNQVDNPRRKRHLTPWATPRHGKPAATTVPEGRG